MSSADLIREAQDPATSPARLAELAQADSSTWPAIVFHPNVYDGLLQWLGERGDPTVDAVLAARAAQVASAAPAPPPVPPAAPAAAPVVAPVAAAPVAQPPVEEPTAVIPAEPTPEPEPTVVIPATEPAPTAAFPAQPTYPAAAPAAATTAAFGAVPPAGADTQPTGTDGEGRGASLGITIAVVAAVLALIAGAAWGTTELLGDDDTTITSSHTKETKAPDTAGADEDEEDEDEPSPVPTVPPAPDPAAGGGAGGPFCTTMEKIQDDSMDLLEGTEGATPDLASIQRKGAEMASSYKSLEASAPAELKADITVMADYFDMVSNPSADNSGKLSDAISAYSKSAQKVGMHYAQNCL